VIQAYIPHGGIGIRVADPRWPKGAVEVAGRPFVAWQLEALEKLGADQAIVRLQYRWREMIRAIGEARLSRLDVLVDVLPDGNMIEVPTALRRVASILEPEFVLLHGDVYPVCSPRMLLAALDHDAAGVMACANAGPDNNVTVRFGRVIDIHNPETANAHDCGIYALRRECVMEARRSEDWSTFLDSFRRRWAVLNVPSRPFEVGSRDGIQAVRAAAECGEL